MRTLINGYVPKELPPPDYHSMMRELHAIGSNLNQIAELVTELSNNTRLWVNGGHTPREMFEKFDKPNLRPLPKEPFVMNRSKRGVIRSEEMNPARVVAGKSAKSVAKAE